MKQAVGDIDFYPNGGEFQPGCSILSFPMLSSITVEDMDLPTPESVSRHLVACAHNREGKFYLFISLNLKIDLKIDIYKGYEFFPKKTLICLSL